MASCGRDGEQPREPEREQIAALRHHQRMQLVEDHAPERAEQIGRVGRGEQQRELLRRGEQDVGRIAPLALALRGRRVAGAGLDADRQLHLGDRPLEIARDVDRERLQRRDVERVQPAGAAHAAAGGDELACGLTRSQHGRCPPLPPRAQRVAGRGRGWGVVQQVPNQMSALTPHPRPLPAASRGEGSRPPALRSPQLNSTSVGRNPASVLPAPVGAISSAERPARAIASSSS